MFLVLFVRKYSKLTKFIQKIDLNARMLRIFSDLKDKSALYIYIYVISRNKLTGLNKGYSSILFFFQTEYKYCYDLVLHYVLHYLNKDADLEDQ